VTNDDQLCEKAQLIRNHAEAVVGGKGVTDLRNMIGYNFRLGEIECAIGIEQLRKLDGLVSSRQHAAERLTRGLTGLDGVKTPLIRPDCTHVYYMYPINLNLAHLGVPRSRIIEALEFEGVVGLVAGYVNIHLLPMFQQKQAYGSKGFPWSSNFCRQDISYARGICPVAEALHESTFLGFEMCLHQLSDAEVDSVIEAFRKVWSNLAALR
jgi:Predicted pyridoxal phosphate-dependent enzyme apparently involved in regulation of cell wall biogenesis